MDLDEILRIGLRSAIIVTIALASVRLFFWLARRDRAKAGVRRPRRLESFTAPSPEEAIYTFQCDKTLAEMLEALRAGTPWKWKEWVDKKWQEEVDKWWCDCLSA